MTEPSGSETNATTIPENVPESLGSIFRRLPPPKVREPSEEQAEKDRAVAQAWSAVAGRVGRRYAACELGTFQVSSEPKEAKAQNAVLDGLRGYANEMRRNVHLGRNIVLYGPPGTGKDHLLVGMLKEAVEACISVDWVNGMTLFERRRDSIDTGVREKDLLGEYIKPQVLAISDPVPPWGDLQQGQAEFLFRLIDQRYRQLKPVWISANVLDGKDATKRIGAQVVDRLRDGGLAFECNWPSYRKVLV